MSNPSHHQASLEQTTYPDFFGRSLPQTAVETDLGLSDLPIRVLAHLGDGVYELLLREWVLLKFPKASVKVIHQESIRLACASFQVTLLNIVMSELNEAEQDILRRGRNASVASNRRNQQALSRLSTSFEALVGFWYLHDPARLTLLKQTMWDLAPLASGAFKKVEASFKDVSDPLQSSEPSPVVKKALFQNLKKQG